jgi:hypothetical protein
MANDAPRRTCGSHDVHLRLLRTDPNYAANRARIENHALEFARTRGLTGRTGVTVIPVVVHVVHNTAAQNISDAQIQSQIDVLNKDYRKTNPDVASTPAVFAPVAADARIEFKLADKDPSGNPTNGITRTSTASASFADDDKVKSSATGGQDPWATDKFLNIWVCPLGGGLLGYAQFPGGPAATDGVVILHSAFGNTGTAAAPFNLGRTATHEIGHFFDLHHIWGDVTDCSGTDFVGDTPNAGGPNFGTPAFPHVTCGNGPNGDMFMNYMDYVDDVAMFMFTAGQVTRMQACLDGSRVSLGTLKAATLKVIDDPSTTLKFGDDPTVKFVDDGGTIKVLDDPPPTLKFRDDPTVKFVDDGGTLKVLDDPPPTLKFKDDPTLKFSDDGGTLKVLDDPQPTLKFRDDPTLKFSDDGGTLKVFDDPQPTLKFRDDGTLKFAEDPIATVAGGDPIGPGDPGGPVEGPGAGPGAGAGGRGAVPFILSTPHHSMAWARSFPQAYQAMLAAVEQQIQELEQVLQQYHEGEQAGVLTDTDRQQAEPVFQEYQRLVAEYQQMTQGG